MLSLSRGEAEASFSTAKMPVIKLKTTWPLEVASSTLVKSIVRVIDEIKDLYIIILVLVCGLIGEPSVWTAVDPTDHQGALSAAS